MNSNNNLLPNEEDLLELQQKECQESHLQRVGFPVVALIFFIGALTFAIALSYNNMAKAIIEQYPFGQGVRGALINFLVVVTVALAVIWVAWKKYPKIVETKII